MSLLFILFMIMAIIQTACFPNTTFIPSSRLWWLLLPPVCIPIAYMDRVVCRCVCTYYLCRLITSYFLCSLTIKLYSTDLHAYTLIVPRIPFFMCDLLILFMFIWCLLLWGSWSNYRRVLSRIFWFQIFFFFLHNYACLVSYCHAMLLSVSNQ